DRLGLAGDEIDEHELRRKLEGVELRLRRKEQRIQEQLIEMPMQFFRPLQRLELEIEVNRLHFLDGDALLLAIDRQSIDAPCDRDVPAATLAAMQDMHLGAIVRIFIRAHLGATRVDVLTEPHPPKAVAALDADAPIRRFINEIADGADESARFTIDAHAVDCRAPITIVYRVTLCVCEPTSTLMTSWSKRRCAIRTRGRNALWSRKRFGHSSMCERRNFAVPVTRTVWPRFADARPRCDSRRVSPNFFAKIAAEREPFRSRYERRDRLVSA